MLGKEAKQSFQNLKQDMTTIPLLSISDFQQIFMVETDASEFGLGAVLSQNNIPVAFYSFTLGVRSREKSIYKKELMTIVKYVLKWRPYLLG